MEELIRVLIADDHDLVRLGLSRVLGEQPDIEVCAVAATGEAAVELTATCDPDVVMLDLTMPGAGGIAAAARIHRTHPLVRVMVLSCHDDVAHIREAFAAGASGYILKDDRSAEVVDAVRAVHRGEVRLSSDAEQALSSWSATLPTPRASAHRWWPARHRRAPRP